MRRPARRLFVRMLAHDNVVAAPWAWHHDSMTAESMQCHLGHLCATRANSQPRNWVLRHRLMRPVLAMMLAIFKARARLDGPLARQSG